MIGNPVEENPIDLLFNRFYERYEIPLHFMKIRVDRPEKLGDALRGARDLGFAFSGITVPYKTSVEEHLDEVDPGSRGIGAINFVEFVGEERRMVGRNTDGEALATSIELKAPIAGQRICILGAGGAARGVGAELARRGARSITVISLNPGRGEQVTEMLRGFGAEGFEAAYVRWQGDAQIPDGTDMVINATPVGAAQGLDELDLDWDSLSAASVAVDVITGPRRTGFMTRAHDLGLTTVDGVDMLIDIVHVDMQHRDIDVAREDVAEYARELAGAPVSAD
ncbi:MAG: shikimate dehydrogenase family protein [Solirubrobacterales bacterium]